MSSSKSLTSSLFDKIHKIFDFYLNSVYNILYTQKELLMKTINDYLKLDYEIVIREIMEADGGGYFAYYKDFKGVMGDGKNANEAMQDVKSAFKCYLEVALTNGEKINEPSYLMKSKRINITIPIYALEKIDTYTKSLNINRSTFLVESALKEVSS